MADDLRPLSASAIEALSVASDGLAILIRLLDHEPDAYLIAGLKETEVGEFFAGLMPVGQGHEEALAFQAALDALPALPDGDTLDDLAADYADCFLTHGYRLSPNGSVWLTEERLERQEPMFAVREWYTHYGLEAPDWRIRADDHLVHELQFVQHLLVLGEAVAAVDAARFMDRHLLPWVPEFGNRMQARCQTRLLATVGGLLSSYLLVMRALLAELTGVEAAVAPLPSDRPNPKTPAQELYMPGAAESW